MKRFLIGLTTLLFSVPFLLSPQAAAQPASPGTQKAGYLGAAAVPITEEVARILGLRDRAGVWVDIVLPDSPAEQAGIVPGDVILAFNGNAIDTPEKLVASVRGFGPGTEVGLQVWRNGATLHLTARLEASDTSVFAKYGSCSTKEATFGRCEISIPVYGKKSWWDRPLDEKNKERKRVFAYFGELRDGWPHGTGTMTVPAGWNLVNFELTRTYRYEGKFENGYPTGEGVVHYGDSVETLSVAGLRKNWGDLAEVTQKWLTDLDGPAAHEYAWLLPGLVMHNTTTAVPGGGVYDLRVIYYSESAGSLLDFGMRSYATWIGRPAKDGGVLFVPEKDSISRTHYRVRKTTIGLAVDRGSGLDQPLHFETYSEAKVQQLQARKADEKREKQESRDRLWGAVFQGLDAAGRAYAETRSSEAASGPGSLAGNSASATAPAALPTQTEQFSYQCAYGSRINVAIPYKTKACLEVKKEFTKIFACNDVDQMERAAAACQSACGNRACDER
jgi:hypothetical protein